MTTRFMAFYFAVTLAALASACSSTPPSSPSEVDAQSIVNRRWVLESLKLNGRAMPLHPKTPQTLEFSASGSITGSGGCNTYFADYALTGADGLTFGPIGATKMACAEGMAEEAQFFEALASIRRLSLPSSTALELQSADGQTVLTFVNQPAASGGRALVGKVWVLAHVYSIAGGVEIDPASPHAPTIEFKNDGTVAGRGGCNQFSGAYELGSASALELKELNATLMACADTDAMTLESAYFEALHQAASYALAGNMLQLSSADGSVLLAFTAQKP